MKKVLLFVMAILFSMVTVAQTRSTLLEEHFDGSSIPAGWSVVGLGSSNWSISTTNYAGGMKNELFLSDTPQFNGISRFVSPAVNLSGIDSAVFSFRHALSNYQGSHKLRIATTSDGGATWNIAWEKSYSTSSSWVETEVINTPDFGKDNVRFCIYFQGNSYSINGWFFDDIEVFTFENTDLSLTSINVEDFLKYDNIPMSITVYNRGLTPVTSVEATYRINGKEPVTETFNVNIPSLGTTTLTFETEAFLAPGDYTMDIIIDKVNGTQDDYIENNIKSKNITVIPAFVGRVPMMEHFTSSTCPYCVSVNSQMTTLCGKIEGRYTYTKYQTNWPGSGDPYNTPEVNTRVSYYGVSSVPTRLLDGETKNITLAAFNKEANIPSFMDVRGSFKVEGNTINVKVDVMPYLATQATIYVSVNEKTTYNNVGTNGETVFYHVMMKMLPNANGTIRTMVPGELQHLEFTQNMSSTHVEEMSDLEVAIWVQNNNSKGIYNSHYAYEYTDEHPYPVQNLTMTQTRDMTHLVSWEASDNATPIGYDVYKNDVLVAENITTTSYEFMGAESFYEVIGVVAKYPDDKTSIKSMVVYDPKEDQGLVSETTNVVLDAEHESAELHLTNANDLTQAPIVINGVEEVNEEGRPYLTITSQDLPLTLNYGESFAFIIEPNMTGEAKSVAQTTVVVSSDAGDVVFMVTVDGDLLSVTELTAETQLFPNPTNGNFTVQGANVAKVEVYNLVGQKVYEAQGNVLHVDAANWNKGLYLVTITNQDGNYETKKVLVK